MTRLVLVDATVLHSFARIGRLDLLELLLDGTGRWTEAVAYEAGVALRSSPVSDPGLLERSLGEPIEIDLEADVERVERLRRGVLGGTVAEPLRHLGAAQSLHVLHNDARFVDARWLSDDAASVGWARRQGLLVWETPDLLQDRVALNELAPREAAGVLSAMAMSDRGGISKLGAG